MNDIEKIAKLITEDPNVMADPGWLGHHKKAKKSTSGLSKSARTRDVPESYSLYRLPFWVRHPTLGDGLITDIAGDPPIATVYFDKPLKKPRREFISEPRKFMALASKTPRKFLASKLTNLSQTRWNFA